MGKMKREKENMERKSGEMNIEKESLNMVNAKIKKKEKKKKEKKILLFWRRINRKEIKEE